METPEPISVSQQQRGVARRQRASARREFKYCNQIRPVYDGPDSPVSNRLYRSNSVLLLLLCNVFNSRSVEMALLNADTAVPLRAVAVCMCALSYTYPPTTLLYCLVCCQASGTPILHSLCIISPYYLRVALLLFFCVS